MKLHFPGYTIWPTLLHVTTLNYYISDTGDDPSLGELLDKFPAVHTLKLFSPPTSRNLWFDLGYLSGRRLRKLKIVCKVITNLGSLSDVLGLEELDVSKCPNVEDFSCVQHIPIVQKCLTPIGDIPIDRQVVQLKRKALPGEDADPETESSDIESDVDSGGSEFDSATESDVDSDGSEFDPETESDVGV